MKISVAIFLPKFRIWIFKFLFPIPLVEREEKFSNEREEDLFVQNQEFLMKFVFGKLYITLTQ